MENLLESVKTIASKSTSALDAYVELYRLEKEIANQKKQILQDAIQECSTMFNGERNVGDYVVKVVTSTSYKYKDDRISNLEELIKNRKNLMKKSYESNNSILDEYGHPVPPASKVESQSLRLNSIKK